MIILLTQLYYNYVNTLCICVHVCVASHSTTCTQVAISLTAMTIGTTLTIKESATRGHILHNRLMTLVMEEVNFILFLYNPKKIIYAIYMLRKKFYSSL